MNIEIGTREVSRAARSVARNAFTIVTVADAGCSLMSLSIVMEIFSAFNKSVASNVLSSTFLMFDGFRINTDLVEVTLGGQFKMLPVAPEICIILRGRDELSKPIFDLAKRTLDLGGDVIIVGGAGRAPVDFAMERSFVTVVERKEYDSVRHPIGGAPCNEQLYHCSDGLEITSCLLSVILNRMGTEVCTDAIHALAVGSDQVMLMIGKLRIFADIRAKAKHNSLRYIVAHCTSKRVVQSCIVVIGISRRHLDRLVKDEVGLTLAKFVSLMRLEKAFWKLAYSNDNIEVIAHSCGYGSKETFSSHFCDMFGQRPQNFAPVSAIGALSP